MTVVYDLLGFQNRDHGERGIARYVLHLALAIERHDPHLISQYLVHPRLPFPPGAEALLATGKVVRTDRREASRAPAAGGVYIAPSLFEKLGDRVDYVYPAWARAPAWRSVAVVYDLIPALYPAWYLSHPLAAYSYPVRTATLAAVDHLLAISEATAADAAGLLGVERDRITVINAGADERFAPADRPAAEVAAELATSGRVPGLRPGYLLLPTGIDPRKNVEVSIEAYGRLDPALRRAHQLVVTCRLDDNGRDLLDDLAATYGVTDDLLATGFVSDADLVTMYQGAHLVAFTSLYEGFGLPVLEAMQCGAPVICSDTSSLVEVQTDPEARFDPSSADAVAAAYRRGLTDEAFRQRLIDQVPPDYSWDDSAARTIPVIERLYAETVSRPAGLPRPRLAVVTPLPPQGSGIATYAARLLAYLPRFAEITVFTDAAADGEPDAHPIPSVEIQTIDRFDAIAQGGGAFDQVVYFLGNSQFHVSALELLRRQPGVVLFHEARLTNLYNHLWRRDPERLVGETVGGHLAEWYPDRYQPWIEELDTIEPPLAQRFGILMAREVTDAASRVLVHSAYAAALLDIDTGVCADVVFPQPCPDIGPAVRASAGRGEVPEPTIRTFGIVDPVKAPERIVAALPLIRDRVPGATLDIVGLIAPAHQRALQDQAGAAGVGDAVSFTGSIGDAEFARLQEETAVAVQLRVATNGESSAAVAELLARGVPTVVSDLGPAHEYPPDVVAAVPGLVEPAELADTVVALLTDPDRRAAVVEASVAYARSHTFAAAAEILAKTVL
ncbi:MAG: glycosyltransferase [Acidimicrobiales bacterium]